MSEQRNTDETTVAASKRRAGQMDWKFAPLARNETPASAIGLHAAIFRTKF
jgi:hypothetical protein